MHVLGLHFSDMENDERTRFLALIGIEQFNRVNDMHGYAIGNEVMRRIGRRLSSAVPTNDASVYRGQGSEFLIVWTGLNENQVADRAQGVMDQICQPYRIKGHNIKLQFHMGLSSLGEEAQDLKTLLENAGLAREESKVKGVNQVQWFQEDVRERITQRQLLEDDLSEALKRGELFLEYQPQVCLDSGKIIGIEALARWRHPDAGLIPPSLFIPLAEEIGIISSIGDWVLKEALGDLNLLEAEGVSGLSLAVNISPIQLADDQFVDNLGHIIRSIGIDPFQLELELTEGSLVRDSRTASGQLAKLRALETSIAIDDFGTGYSSLAYLVRLPVDKLKIDRSFVSNMSSGKAGQAVVETIIAMAKALDLKVLAEGIEQDRCVPVLRDAGCHIGQGYLFGKPMKVSELLEFIRNWDPQNHREE